MNRLALKLVIVAMGILVVYLLPTGRTDYLVAEGEIILANQLLQAVGKAVPHQLAPPPERTVGEVITSFFVKQPDPPKPAHTAIHLQFVHQEGDGTDDISLLRRLTIPPNVQLTDEADAQFIVTFRFRRDKNKVIAQGTGILFAKAPQAVHRLERSDSLLAPVVAS